VAAIAESIPRISVVRKAVLPLFLISGAAGLIYEVTWTRAFGVVFGNTVFAVSTVLTAFMLGLALGSWFFGKIADRNLRPLRLYALLELGIGAYAFLFPALLAATDSFYRWFFLSFRSSFYLLSLVRFVLSIIILLFPTALMGGTLPVLSKLWANPPTGKGSDARIGQSVGLLYAVNTFGAVMGSFLSGYLLMKILGVSNTIYLAACANILVGAVAFALSRYAAGLGIRIGLTTPSAAEPAETPGKKSRRPPRHLARTRSSRTDEATGDLATKRTVVLAAVAVAGFCALALEVLWTRVLVFVLTTSVYAFVCMLTCFLLGIALGSFLSSRLLLGRIRNPVFALGVVEMLVALSALGSVALLGKLWHIDYALTWKLHATGFWKEVVTHFIDSSVVLLLPTMLMGAAFPIAVKACAQSWKAVGKRVGEVYAFNTVGCVVGSFAAGFVMVPLLGLRDSFLIVVAILFSLGVVVIFSSEKSRTVLGVPAATASAVALIVGFLGIPRDVFLRTMNTYHYPSRIVYIKDDATGTVTVHDLPDGERLIAVDGVDVAGMTLMLRTTQKLQGYIPLLMHENPKKVLQIGYGSGETSGVGLAFGADEYSIVEICPGVFDAGRFFQEINRGSYRNPDLRKVIMDGKNFVKLTDQKFDVIMNDSTYPGTTGSSALYTYDHLEKCRQRLRPGGVLSCWVPLDLRPEDFRIIVRSFQEVMPHSSLWMSNNSLNKHSVLLGTLSPLRIDFQRVKKLVERPDTSSDLARINIHSVYDLLDCFVVGENALRKIAGEGPLNTDDRPFLEFGAAVKRDIDKCFTLVLQEISESHSPVLPYVVNLGDAEEKSREVRATFEQYFTGTGHAFRGLVAMLQGDPEKMNHQFRLAQAANPNDRDVESCLEELGSEVKALVEAVERMPRSATLRWRLAEKYLLMQDYERASEQFLSLLNLDAANAAAWNNLGVCYKEMKLYDKAVSAFEKALQWDASTASAYFGLGEVYGELGDFASSSRNYQKALSLTPRSRKAYVYNRLAWAHFKQRQYTLALEAIDKAIQLAPDDPDLQTLLRRRRDEATRMIAAEGET